MEREKLSDKHDNSGTHQNFLIKALDCDLDGLNLIYRLW